MIIKTEAWFGNRYLAGVRYLGVVIGFLLPGPGVLSQQTISLYCDSIPNSTTYRMTEIPLKKNEVLYGYRNISLPTLSIYLPPEELSNGTAVIICPGGGYYFDNFVPEGVNIAEAFNRHGIAAFVLKYRLPSDSIMTDKSIGPLQDAQQAIRIVRSRAAEWKVDTGKVGIMGFSAGGHLASTAGTHFNTSYIPNKENINLRPDFMILVYPVISFTNELAHMGSRDRLIGKDPTDERIKFFSSELQVNSHTPPCWIIHAGDDVVVDVENSIRFYEALHKNKVPAELHVYPKGNHGFVLSLPEEEWMRPLFLWMQKNNWVK